MILTLIWPVIAIYFLFKNRRAREENLYLSPLCLILVPVLCTYLYKYYVTSDVERLGGYVLSTTYYEDWDEYVSKTCTRTYTDSNGNTQTETYDCSYVDYHPEYYEIETTLKTINITEDKFNELVAKFGNKSFVDMHRWYHSNDGDKYVSKWSGKHSELEPVTVQNHYENKLLAASSLFNFDDISDVEAEKLGLYKWPEVYTFNDNPILGHNNYQATTTLQKFNATHGAEQQIRVWLLVYDKPHSIIQRQRSYWKGGKKNEIVLCLGYGGRVNWADGFCWSPNGYTGNDELLLEWRNYCVNRTDINECVNKFVELSHKWKRKEFKEFDYLTVNVPMWMYATAHGINILISILIVFVITKDNI